VCAALFGGVTLHSAAYLISRSKNFTPDMLHTWDEVRMLIIDEISFSTNGQMEKLNQCLNHIRKKSILERKYCGQIEFLEVILLFFVEIFVKFHQSKQKRVNCFIAVLPYGKIQSMLQSY
jgi:hypothetical protein